MSTSTVTSLYPSALSSTAAYVPFSVICFVMRVGVLPVGILATVEAGNTIKTRLSYGGVYMSNVLGAIEGSRSKFLRAEVKTLSQVFRHVYVIPVREGASHKQFMNWMVIATDNDDYYPEDAIDLGSLENDLILTDDYCPIDSLISTDYQDS